MGCSKDEFSCAGGGCVSWALTCNGEKDCEDGTDEPLFCKKQGELSIWENDHNNSNKKRTKHSSYFFPAGLLYGWRVAGDGEKLNEYFKVKLLSSNCAT